MIIRVAGAVKLQHNVSDKVIEQKVRKLFSNALPSSGWRGMVGRKGGMSPADLQRQVKKDIRDAARRRKAAKSATATAPQTHASRAVHMRLWSTVVVCGSTTANTWCLIFNNCVRVCARFTQCFTERSCSQGHLFCSTFTLNAVTQLGAVLALYFSRCFFLIRNALSMHVQLIKMFL